VDLWGFDASFYRTVMPYLREACEKLFHLHVTCEDRPPWRFPRIFVSNHASFLPLDAVAIQCALDPLSSKPPIRPLLEDYVFTLPYVGLWASRLGAVRACQENATLLLERGYSVLAFPEGVKGAQKTVFERDRVQRFGRGGIVRLALKTGFQVVPTAIAGPEKAYPVVARLERAGRSLGLPFLPVTPAFPWLGLLGLCPIPTRFSVLVGEPMDLRALAGNREPDEATVLQLNEQVRQRVSELLHRALR